MDTYEKKYKEALEIAQKLYQDCPNGKNDRLYHTTDLEKMFPELRESEDEKIRKELIEHVKDQQSSFISAPDCRDKYEEEENNKYNSWLAWLEKQGSPKSAPMQNGIIINGVEYELIKDDEADECDRCALKDLCSTTGEDLLCPPIFGYDITSFHRFEKRK